MDLHFDLKKATGYKSPSQIARVLTEDWGKRVLFCASCDRNTLDAAPDNTAVFDFVCGGCRETYQMKSQRKPLGEKFLDSAYEPMMRSIKKNMAPNLLLMHYDAEDYCVENLIVVPRYFLSASCIEPRKPLSSSARRAGWVGCNIVLRQLPADGRISIVREGTALKRKTVRRQYERFKFLADRKTEVRGWTSDVLKVVRSIGEKEFTLEEVYAFESHLRKLHPDNKHLRPKIRQQLQLLRDKGVLEFKGKGRYRVV